MEYKENDLDHHMVEIKMRKYKMNPMFSLLYKEKMSTHKYPNAYNCMLVYVCLL